MLEKLRGMAIFASVVKHESFSGAAKELGITTSAVSQQIRSLEIDLGASLLHRSTRKLSLTEAGEQLYESAAQMVEAAEQGRDKVRGIRDEVAGSLRIATLPKIASAHIIPALSEWLQQNEDLSVHFIAKCGSSLDMIDDRVDLGIMLTTDNNDDNIIFTEVKQLLLASPEYLKSSGGITQISDLDTHTFITCNTKSSETFELKKDDETFTIKVSTRITTNSTQLAMSLAEAGYGLIKVNEIEAADFLKTGRLVPVLEDYSLSTLLLSAQVASKEHQPAKVQICLEKLKVYFENLKKQ